MEHLKGSTLGQALGPYPQTVDMAGKAFKVKHSRGLCFKHNFAPRVMIYDRKVCFNNDCRYNDAFKAKAVLLEGHIMTLL